MMTVVPGADEALAFLMHVDNHGPQTAEEVWGHSQVATCAFASLQVDGVGDRRVSSSATSLPECAAHPQHPRCVWGLPLGQEG